MDSKFTAYEKAREIAPFLKGFSVDTTREVGDHYSQLINGEEVIGLYVVTYGSNAGRLEVSGGYPVGPDGENLSNGLYDYSTGRSVHVIPPRIGINGNRPPAKIAADIERRFLPEYREVLAKVKELKAKRDAYKGKVGQNVKELLAVCNGKPNRADNSFYIPFDGGSAYGDVEVYDDSVNLKLSSIPLPLAKQILKLVAEAKAKVKS